MSGSLTKIVVLLLLGAVVVSLCVAFLGVWRGRGHGEATVRALTLRVLLSICLFALLILAGALGLIKPHGLGG